MSRWRKGRRSIERQLTNRQHTRIKDKTLRERNKEKKTARDSEK